MTIQLTKSNIEPLNKSVLQKFSWREYFILVFAGMIGMLGGLLAAWSVMEKTAALSKVPIQILAAGQLLQSTVWMFFTVGVGLLLAARTGLGAPLLRGYLVILWRSPSAPKYCPRSPGYRQPLGANMARINSPGSINYEDHH